ncbi:HPF/RaiA family ribosome-associated protein [Sungkyunkwania multivorans]|uniref:HPF/RaiA family ribosome-associated protein n=1 Tax=Sungkyunkwania multivorans TaxID=1173618 RepID=A0ABW3CS59_9FLAO
MQLVFEYHDVTASDRLEEAVKEKMARLGEKYDFVHRADIFFKNENTSDDLGKICDIRLSAPGPRIFASTNADSYLSAIAETVRDLDKQLEKRKVELYH